MSTGTCAGMICPTPLGTVTVTGDTTGSLDFSVALAPDVNFHAEHSGGSGTGDAFWFDLSAGGNPIAFALGSPTSGTIGGEAWNWVTPFSAGSFTPAPGADFPGPYADLVQCTNATAGNICGNELNFTASGADATHPFVIGLPRGAGNFLDAAVPFVANLSIAPDTAALCHEDAACTGLVGSPRALDLDDDVSRVRGAWLRRVSRLAPERRDHGVSRSGLDLANFGVKPAAKDVDRNARGRRE